MNNRVASESTCVDTGIQYYVSYMATMEAVAVVVVVVAPAVVVVVLVEATASVTTSAGDYSK